MLRLVAAPAFCFASLALPAWAADKRVALVIGVGAYRNVPALANPPRDAKLIAPLLQKLGFETDMVIDPADRAALEDAVRRFSKRMQDAKMPIAFSSAPTNLSIPPP